MNKRQLKKKYNKCSFLMVDEMNLLTMNDEERKQAFLDYEKYCHKHCCYYHYKDKYNHNKMSFYSLPTGDEYNKKMKNVYDEMIKRGRKYIVKNNN